MLRSMEITVPLPIKVQVDNIGAIWLANNSSVSERTKHVDLRAHFVRDMIKVTEVWHMAHFWVSYGRCTMPGSPMGRSEGSSRRWTG